MANEVATKAQKTGLSTYLNNPAVKANIISVIGEEATQRFIADTVAVVQANPQLKECTNTSMLNASLTAHSLKLSLSPAMGQSYPVPFKDNKKGVTEAVFQIGCAGYKQLAIRSGQYRKIVSSVIKEGELKSFNPITEDFEFDPILDPEVREKAKTVGYYAMFELLNGYRKEIYWPVARMEAHASKYSQTYKADKKYGSKRSIWTNNFDAMAEKTMIRTLIRKWGVMSIDMQKAVNADMGVINDDGSVTYVDNQPDVVEEAHEAIEAGANTQEFMDVEFSEVPTAGEVNADNPFAEG